jgi:hypothetical protein
MTYYIIGVGYNSGSSCKEYHNNEKAWELLKSVVIEICNNPEKITEEAHKFNAPETCQHGPTCCTLAGHAERYKLPWKDLTIRFDEENQTVVQLASGDREVKEHIRRAFCRLVLYAMHKHNVEINITVG